MVKNITRINALRESLRDRVVEWSTTRCVCASSVIRLIRNWSRPHMIPEQARALGRFLKERRTALGLSTRALAARSGVDMATVVRLEQGAFVEPRPDPLRVIAKALGVSLADVFALADYVVPSELPTFTPYLRAQIRSLSRQGIAAPQPGV